MKRLIIAALCCCLTAATSYAQRKSDRTDRVERTPTSTDRQRAEREHQAIVDATSGKTDADWKLGEDLARENKRAQDEVRTRPEALPKDFSVTERPEPKERPEPRERRERDRP